MLHLIISCHHIMSYHISSYHVTSHHIMLHLIISCHHIMSCHVTSHHITSHHIMLSYHVIISCHVTSHHVTSHHIMLHHITSHSVYPSLFLLCCTQSSPLVYHLLSFVLHSTPIISPAMTSCLSPRIDPPQKNIIYHTLIRTCTTLDISLRHGKQPFLLDNRHKYSHYSYLLFTPLQLILAFVGFRLALLQNEE